MRGNEIREQRRANQLNDKLTRVAHKLVPLVKVENPEYAQKGNRYQRRVAKKLMKQK